MPKKYGDKTITPEKLEVFLKHYSETCSVRQSCHKAKISRSAFYRKLKENDPDFVKKVEEAREIGVRSLEDKAFERTADSDQMLMWMLKHNYPKKYMDTSKLEVDGQVSVKLNMILNDDKTD